MPTISGFYNNVVVGALRAAGQIEHWDRGAINPSGFRHHESGQYRSDAKKQIALCGGFKAQKESGVAIDFGEVILPNGSFMTDTIPITFNLGEVNSHKDSFFNKMVNDKSIGQDFKAFNMRFWLGSLSAFSGMPQPTFYFRNSAEWKRGYSLGILDPGVAILPTGMPNNNVFSKAPSTVFISGNFIEKEFSHFIYVRGVFPSGTYPLGTYGGLGKKTFTFKFSYDWTKKDANVLNTDL